jgi:hypothetical protein
MCFVVIDIYTSVLDPDTNRSADPDWQSGSGSRQATPIYFPKNEKKKESRIKRGFSWAGGFSWSLMFFVRGLRKHITSFLGKNFFFVIKKPWAGSGPGFGNSLDPDSASCMDPDSLNPDPKHYY